MPPLRGDRRESRSTRRGAAGRSAAAPPRRAGLSATLLLAAALACLSPEAARAMVAFLYADANEGGASGGHVALRIDGQVYHYQRDASDALVIARDAWSDFAFQYRVVENRSLRETPLEAAPEIARRLRRHLDARWLGEAAERAHLDALRDDVALLEALSRPGVGRVPLRGAGFFAEGAAEGDGAGRAGLARLRARIDRERGAGFRTGRRRAARGALLRLPPPNEANDAAGAGPFAATLSLRHGEAHAALRALAVLHAAPPLRRDALRALPGAAGRLDAPARTALRARASELASDLAALIASPRPDWGFPFLLGAARLAALEESLASGRLQVLDAAAREAAGAPLSGDRPALARRLAWRRERLERARRAFLANPDEERAAAALESAAARHAELDAALRTGVAPPRSWAARRADGRALVVPPPPAFAARDLVAPLDRARARLASAEAARARRARYDLVSRNCVTELFRQVERALAGSPAPWARPPEAPLAFVPFLAERAIRADAAPASARTLPSLRRAGSQRAREAGWLASLRESNVLTSTLYTAHPGDSLFIFFTDDARWSRPLRGAANLAVGAAGAALGVLALPFDGGSTALRGLRGSVASVPELFFFNIRKGTYPLALPDDAPRDDVAGLRRR